MEIVWKVYLTETGRRSKCNCDKFDGEHQLGRHYVINRVDCFDSSKGYCMEVCDPDNCAGATDLLDHLHDLGILSEDILYVEPEGISDEDREINDMVRRLESKDIFPVFDVDDVDEVYIVPAVLEGGLVEYQVSDGLPEYRSTSIDVYSYSEAKRIFDHLSQLGWKEGVPTL